LSFAGSNHSGLMHHAKASRTLHMGIKENVHAPLNDSTSNLAL
jgi:hypothetical protein